MTTCHPLRQIYIDYCFYIISPIKSKLIFFFFNQLNTVKLVQKLKFKNFSTIEKLRYFNLLQVQFVAIMVHAFQLLFIDCNYPKAFVWWIGMHAVMFYFLFSQFYKESYNQRKSKVFWFACMSTPKICL